MARIAVLGGTGYSGRHIVTEAVGRGHCVTSWSRRAPMNPVPGARYETGSLTDPEVIRMALSPVDVAIGAVSPRGDMDGRLCPTYRAIAAMAESIGVRFFVVGGSGSLLTSDGLRVLDRELPEDQRREAMELDSVLRTLRTAPDPLNWTYLSPAVTYGALAEGRRTGRYRLGRDELLTDAAGRSAISGADLAIAVLDEIEWPSHERQRFTVAY